MLVSVYMPTKNRVRLLQRAVQSVLTQSHREIELWVVDDGSSDATWDYLQRAAADDSRLRILRNEQSRGAPRARNAAIERANGEFVTGLDDDDEFHEQRIEKLVAAWQEHERRGERFSCLFTQDLQRAGTRTEVSRKPAQVTYEDLFFYNTIGNQVFTRRDYLIEAGLFDEGMPAWQDLDMFMRLLQVHGPARLVDEPLYVLAVEQRGDRISLNRQRIDAAYRRLAEKVADRPQVLQQALFLQRFGQLYGYDLRLDDWRAFWRFGIHRRTLKRFAGIVARQWSSALRPRNLAEPDTRAAANRHDRLEDRPRNRARRQAGIAMPRVLMFPKHSDNPYLNTLSQRLERSGAQVEDFTFARAFRERHDVLHIHWPDLHLHARSWWRSLARQARLAAVFAWYRLRGAPVVWTVHNLQPHERHQALPSMLFPLWFPRLCSHVIAMTSNGLAAAQAMYPPLKRKMCAVIPHGDYRHAYSRAPTRSEARERLGLLDRFTFLFLGKIRPYKNVPKLIRAFRALERDDVQLLIVGEPGHTMDVGELQRAIADDPRIRLELQFVPDEDVPLYMAAADRVVLPFDSILNSGSVLLALSFDRPVTAPRLGALPEIQQRVGRRWLALYEGALATRHLAAALEQPPAREETVDLSAFDWDSIIQQTLDFYGIGPAAARALQRVPAHSTEPI